MSTAGTEVGFRERSRAQLARPVLREAIPNAVDHAAAALDSIFAGHDREALRAQGAAIRQEVIDDLPGFVDRLEGSLERNGVHVHRAANAAEACTLVQRLLVDAKVVVKAKSMLSEEIELNAELEASGIEVVETDLGEYLVQLDGERPSHIIGPAIHKTREDVRRTLSHVAGRELDPEPEALAAFARETLRDLFLRADAGITGANFAVAETGTIVLVSNEGNARLTTSLPRVHIALVGIERVVPRLEDLGVLLPLLTGHGTGQRITSYVTLVDGPRRPGEPDGPDEVHVVLIDNGRSAIARSQYREILRCIRCGACQNVCPVYRQVGGHAYGWVYGGPIGAVLEPLLRGAPAAELAQASTLCGACDDVCPVGIPIHELLVELRRPAPDRPSSRREAMLAWFWSLLWRAPWSYTLSRRAGIAALRPLARKGVVRRAPGPLRRWTEGRVLTLPGRGSRRAAPPRS